MYVVKIENGGVETEIHGVREKLASGSVSKGINVIDAFSFSAFPSNVGFNALNEFTTLVKVYNTNRDRYEFYGRVLYSNPSMSENGRIKKEVTCESYLGFLCDSQQKYVEAKNWTVNGLLSHIISVHNSQVEEYKQFKVGRVTVADPNDNLYLGIQRDNTWVTLNDKLIDVLGGEISFRVEDDGLYLDYLVETGEAKTTAIKLSHNMQAISKENDPTKIVTRFIPLGCKLEDSEERLDITSVNGGVEYIDDKDAIALYGIHVGYKEWDDVTTPSQLLAKGKAWLAANNKALVKYSVTALDLSLIGMDVDDFDVGNSHPIQNVLLGIDDTARIIKKTIDICDESKTSIEIGDIFKQLTDLQKERDKEIKSTSKSVSNLSSSARSLGSRVSSAESGLKQVNLEVNDLGYRITSAELILNGDGSDANAGLIAQVTEVKSNLETTETRISAAELLLSANGVTATSKLSARVGDAEAAIILKVDKDGVIDAVNGSTEKESDGTSVVIKASKVDLGGYATVGMLEAEVATIDKFFSGSAKATYIKTASLNADSANIDGMSFDGTYVSWKTATFLTSSTSLTVDASGGTVTGVTLNKKTSTINYLGN